MDIRQCPQTMSTFHLARLDRNVYGFVVLVTCDNHQIWYFRTSKFAFKMDSLSGVPSVYTVKIDFSNLVLRSLMKSTSRQMTNYKTEWPELCELINRNSLCLSE